MLFAISSIVLMVGLGFTLFYPIVGLCLFTVMLYILPVIISPIYGYLHVTRLFGIVTFLVLLMKGQKKGRIKWFDSVPSKWLLAFLIMLCLSVLTSIWRSNSISIISGMVKFMIGYFLIINIVDSPKGLRAIIFSMVLPMLYIIVLAIQKYYSLGLIYSGSRMFGALRWALFSDPNDMALGLIMLIPFIYFDLLRKKNFLRKIFSLIVLGVFFWGIILTQSRGGLIGLLAMLIVLWLKSKKKIILSGLLIVGLVAGWGIAPEAYKERIINIKYASEDDAAAISRLDAWKAGFSMMRSRPLGVGAGNFTEGFFIYRPENAIGPSGRRLTAHNMFILVGGESGFIGLLVFLLLILSSFKVLNKIKRKVVGAREKDLYEIALLSDAVFVSLVGYCASGLFLSQSYNFLLYYLIAFSVALENMVFQKEIASEK